MSDYRLRCWRRNDALGFRAAVGENLQEFRQWMNWAFLEPGSLGATVRLLHEYETDFRLDVRWRYAIVDAEVGDGEVLGGASIHPRLGEGGLEIGYWLRGLGRGRGLATAAVHALTTVSFEQHNAERVEIHCDHGNDRSIAVALRLGFKDVGEVARTRPDGEHRIATIYRLERNEFPTPRMLTIRGLPQITVED